MRKTTKFTSVTKYRNADKAFITGDAKYNKEAVNKLYRSLKFSKFVNLSKERMLEIDNLAIAWAESLRNHLVNTPSIMSTIANQLIASRPKFNLASDDEVLYFYVKVVDPKFKFLELSQIAQDKKELINLVIRQFGIYDNVIIYLEENLDRRLQELEQT